MRLSSNGCMILPQQYNGRTPLSPHLLFACGEQWPSHGDDAPLTSLIGCILFCAVCEGPCKTVQSHGIYTYSNGDCHDCCSNGCDNCACNNNQGSCSGMQSLVNAACQDFYSKTVAVNNVASFLNQFSNSGSQSTSGSGGAGFGSGSASVTTASSGASQTVYDGHHNIVVGACAIADVNTYTCHTNDHQQCAGPSWAQQCWSTGRTGSQSVQVKIQYTVFDPSSCGA